MIATREARSVGELVDWRRHVEIDPRYRRPTELDNLCGDASKAESVLGWMPTITFQPLIQMMVTSYLELAPWERTLRDAGDVLRLRGAAAR